MENIEEIRKHFRRETGKLDNWIQQPLRITDFCNGRPDFYDDLKILCEMLRDGDITADEWRMMVGRLLRKHDRRILDADKAT